MTKIEPQSTLLGTPARSAVETAFRPVIEPIIAAQAVRIDQLWLGLKRHSLSVQAPDHAYCGSLNLIEQRFIR